MNIYISMALLYLLVINNFESAYIFGISFIITNLLSFLIISLFGNKLPSKLRVISSLLVSASTVTLIELVLSNYIPTFYNEMSIYLPLMMLSLYDYRQIPFKQKFKNTFIKSIKYVGLLLGLVLIKEIFSYGTITLMNHISSLTGYREIIKIGNNNILPIPYFDTFGSFILAGLALGIGNKIRRGKNA